MGIKRDKLDAAVSDYVRARDKWQCRHCKKVCPDGRAYGKSRIIEAAHIVGRRSRSTRWDVENIIALCSGCHRKFTENPVDFTYWLEGELGREKLEQIRRKGNQVRKWVQEEKDELLELILYELSDMDEHDPDLFLDKLRGAGL